MGDQEILRSKGGVPSAKRNRSLGCDGRGSFFVQAASSGGGTERRCRAARAALCRRDPSTMAAIFSGDGGAGGGAPCLARCSAALRAGSPISASAQATRVPHV
jgi:hypothetical protein